MTRVTAATLQPSREARLVNLVASGLLLVLGLLMAGAAVVLAVWLRDPGLTSRNASQGAYLWLLGLPGLLLVGLAVAGIGALGRRSALGLWVNAFVGAVIAFLGAFAGQGLGVAAGLGIGGAGLWGLLHSARH